MIRLLKLGRLFRLKKLTKLLEEECNINMHWLKMMKVLGQVVFLIHMLSCLGYWLASPACPNDSPEPCESLQAEDRPWSTWVRMFHVDRINLMSRYLASFHLVTATVMAVGYGDIYPTNVKERMFSIVTQLIGAITFGFILSAVTTLLESSSPRSMEAKNRMNQLKEWLSSRDLPSGLRSKVWNHHTYLNAQKSSFKDEADILEKVPALLRIKLIEQIRQEDIKRLVHIFPNEDVWLVTEVAMLLRPFQCAQNECIVEAGEPPLDLFFVKTGRIEAVLDEDFPEDVEIIMAENMSSAGSYAATTFSSKEDLRSAGSPHQPIGRPAAPRPPEEPPVPLPGTVSGGAAASLDMPRQQAESSGASASQSSPPPRLRPPSPPDPLRLPPDDDGTRHEAGSPNVHTRRNSKRASVDVALRLSVHRRSSLSGVGSVEEKISTVLCAIYCEGEAFGECPVSPVRLQGADARSEVLALSKDELECVLSQFTNAGDRFSEFQRQAMRALWEAVMSEENTQQISWCGGSRRRLKSRLLYNGRTTPVNELPAEAFQAEADALLHAKAELIFPTKLKDATGRYEMRNETCTDLWARWVLSPHSARKMRWDFFLGSLIIYSVVIIPYRFGFNVEINLAAIVTDIVVDIFFLLDMIANFRCCIVDAEGITNTDPGDIWRHYLSGWFVTDFLSTFPIDWVLEAIVPGGGKDSRAVKLIRFARLFRLLKLARVFKLGRIMDAANSTVEIPPVVIRMGSLLLKICFMAHLVGCFWYYITTIEFSWSECISGKFGCEWENDGTSWFRELGEGSDTDTNFKKYVVTLYWVFTTMTTVGYGDITPTNDLERLYAVIVMIFGATVFGYIIGSIAELSNGSEDALGSKLCLIRDFCDERGLSHRTQSFVQRHYAFWYQEMTPLHDEPRLLHELPPSLRKEVILYIHRQTIRTVALFKTPLPDWFVSTTVRLLEPQAFSPGADIIGPDEAGMFEDIIFVQEGKCEAYRPCNVDTTYMSSAGLRQSQCPRMSEVMRRRAAHQQEEASYGVEYTGDQEEEVHEDEVVEVIEAGMMWGFQMLLTKTIERRIPRNLVCLRCAHEEPCFVYTIRYGVLSEIHAMQKELGSMIQEVLADAIMRQVLMKEGMPDTPGHSNRAFSPQMKPMAFMSTATSNDSLDVSSDRHGPRPAELSCNIEVSPRHNTSHPFGAPLSGDQSAAVSRSLPGSGSGGSGSAESPAAAPGLRTAAAMCSDDGSGADLPMPPADPATVPRLPDTLLEPTSPMAADAEAMSPEGKRQASEASRNVELPGQSEAGTGHERSLERSQTGGSNLELTDVNDVDQAPDFFPEAEPLPTAEVRAANLETVVSAPCVDDSTGASRTPQHKGTTEPERQVSENAASVCVVDEVAGTQPAAALLQ
jgi:hypothetical protein